MPSVAMPADIPRASAVVERWSIPRAAAFILLVSGALWLIIAGVAGWILG